MRRSRAGGFIGRSSPALLARGALETASGGRGSRRITLFDVAEAEGLPDDPRLTSIARQHHRSAEVHRAFRDDVGGVFHLAAIVSANAEDDFDLGVRVNLGHAQRARGLPRCRGRHLVFARLGRGYGVTCRRCSTTARS